MKYLLPILVLLFLLPTSTFALSVSSTCQGGSGTSTPSGILYGDGLNNCTTINNALKSVTIGSGLSFLGGTLSATGGGGSTLITAGTGISTSTSSGGAVLVTNTGVTSIVAGTNITISGATGAVTINASGGGGTGPVSTSTHEIANQIPIWTSNSGTPALLGQITNTTNGFVLALSGGVPTWVATSTINGNPGGLNVQLQYNNAGVFGGISGATTNGTIVSLTNPLLGGATLTTSSVNGVTLTTGGGTTTFLNANGAYSTPVGTTYTGTYPVQISGSTISLAFGTTTSNTWTGLQTFSNSSTTLLSATYASSTAAFFGTLNIPSLGTPAGSFLAVNAAGQVIATTTPSGGSGSGTVGSGTTGQFPYYAANGTTLTATSSIFLATNQQVDIATTSSMANTVLDVAIPTAGDQILINDFPDAIDNDFGYGSVGNGSLNYGFLNGNAHISFSFFGAATLVGSWLFPANAAYPSPLLGFANGSGGATGLRVETSGTGSNQTVYGYTSDFSGSGQAPNLSLGANGFTFGVTNCFTLSYVNCITNGNSTPVLTIASSTLGVAIGTTTPASNIELTVASSTTATTTVEFGDRYSTGSKTCFNVKNTAGALISFYFVGTAMVTENNLCK